MGPAAEATNFFIESPYLSLKDFLYDNPAEFLYDLSANFAKDKKVMFYISVLFVF